MRLAFAMWANTRCAQHFGEREIVYLTMAINLINTYNRLSIATRTRRKAPRSFSKSCIRLRHARPRDGGN